MCWARALKFTRTVCGTRTVSIGTRLPRRFLVIDIGLHYWEEIDIVAKGANYGYPEREGNEQLFVDDAGKTGSLENPPVAFPDRDLLHVDGIEEPVVPIYPAAVYSHWEGDSIGSGFVYRGKLMPQMRGKFIFNDMTTGPDFLRRSRRNDRHARTAQSPGANSRTADHVQEPQ